MADPIKDYYLNQYTGATSGLNQPVTMTDSPIFQKGFEKWDPTSAASLYAGAGLPAANLYSKFTGSDKKTYGLAGLGSGAAFKQMPKNPTGIEQLKFADVFGHEMSHLGWDYKPRGERINVPGVGKEGGPKVTSDYTGEEQWNYMNDLMYGPRKDYSSDFGNLTAKDDIAALQKQLASGKITPSVFKAEASNILNKAGEPSYISGYNYLTGKELINPGDLSYTPKAFNEIAWSGLTTPSKQAIGFGINPFEDTRAAGQWNQIQQQQKKKNQMLAWQKMKQKQMAPRSVFPGGYVSAADVAKKKATPAYTGPVTHSFDPKQDTGRRADKPGGFTDPGKGSYGPHKAYGGRVSYFDGGLLSLWPR